MYLVIYVVRHLLLGMIHHMLLLIVTNKFGHSAPRGDDRMITKNFPFHDRIVVVIRENQKTIIRKKFGHACWDKYGISDQGEKE